MHKIVVLAALAVLLQAPAAMAKPAAIDDFLGPILASPAEPGIIKSRCDQMLAEADRRLNELELEHGAATIGRTLQRYDDLHKLLTDAGNEFTLYQQVSGDQERRDAGSDCVVRLTSEATKLSLSRRVYDRLKAIDGRRADPATRLYLTRTLQAFERAGVDQPLAKRAEIQALQEKIARASADFESNIAKGRKTVMADPAELAGLPPDFLRAHPPAPDGKITISTDYTDYIPVMAYAASSPLRRRLYLAFQTRAYPENDARLREILDWRQQLAMKLGRPNYAALALEDKMLDTPDKVERLIHDMAEAARPAAERDYARKLALLRTINPAASQIEPWDNSWLSQQVQKRDYAYDRQEARRYFAYDIVRNGILRLTEGLFGVEIRPWQTPVWDRSVEAYEMFDNGRLIGRFYFDSHPRPGKYSHANAISLRDGVAGRVVPLAALVMNLPAGGHATGLMEHDDVVTFLHEFGHLLHTIFGGQQRWQGQAAQGLRGRRQRQPDSARAGRENEQGALLRPRHGRHAPARPLQCLAALPPRLGPGRPRRRLPRLPGAIRPHPPIARGRKPGQLRPPHRLLRVLLHLPLVEGDR
ncbi:MAG: hypothetical protein JF593_10745 [Novosphingobium sp.]|nr:hypothetical protein [Novosphingobium sp.]